MSSKITVKFNFKNEIRRISVSSDIKFDGIVKFANELFKSSFENATFKYRDSEGDLISISSDIELSEAFSQAINHSIKFVIVPQQQVQPNSGNWGNWHGCPGRQMWWQQQACHNATCDGCENRIIGVRNKCQQCPDYDLCEKCFEKNKDGSIHANHTFQVIERPQRRQVHPATCDGCQSRIAGVRHKCQQCPDYDLCEKCFEKNKDGSIHANHSFETIEFATWHHWNQARQLMFQRRQQEQSQSPKVEAKQVVQPKPIEQPKVESVKPLLKLHAPLPKIEQPKPVEQPKPLLKLHAPLPKIEQPKPIEQPKVESVKPLLKLHAPLPKIEQPKPVEQPKVSNDNSVSPFESKLKQLEEMGFVDRQNNIKVLIATRGDMFEAVRKLLQ